MLTKRLSEPAHRHSIHPPGHFILNIYINTPGAAVVSRGDRIAGGVDGRGLPAVLTTLHLPLPVPLLRLLLPLLLGLQLSLLLGLRLPLLVH